VISYLVFLLAGIGAAGTFYYRHQARHARVDVEQHLVSVSQLKMEQIAAWRAERLADAAMLMESSFFSEGVARWLAGPNSEDAEKILTRFRALQKNGHYSEVLLLDGGGQALFSVSGRPSLLHEEERQALALALRERRPVMTDLHTGHGDAAVYLDIVAPLFAGHGAAIQPVGAVVLQAEARQVLYPLIQAWPTPSRSPETYLVRRDGDAALFLNESRHQKDTALKLRIPLTSVEVPAVMAVLGKKGVVEGTDYRGVNVVAALNAVPDSPWLLVTKMDTEEAFEAWRMQAGFILGLMVLLVAVVLAAATAVWQMNAKAYLRMQATDKLRASEAMLNEMGRIAKIGGWVIDLEKGTVTWTREVYAIHEVEESYQPTVAAGINFYVPESRPVIQQAVERAMQTGEPFDVELEMSTAKQRRIWVQARGRAVLVSGQAQTISGTFQDITDRKRANDEIRQLNAELEQRVQARTAELGQTSARIQLVLDSTGDGIYGIGLDGHCMFINRAALALLGYAAPEEVLGRNNHDLWHHSHADGSPYAVTECPIYLALRGQPAKPVATEVFWRKDGTSLPVEYTALPINDGGHVIGCVVSFSDITERKQAEGAIRRLNAELVQQAAQLVEANKELESFSYSVSHDLRAPLRHIDGFTTMLQKHAEALDEKGRRYLSVISEAAKKMGRLINDLLVFSRMGRAALTQAPVALDQVTRGVLRDLETDSKGRQIEWVMEPLPVAQGDLAMLRQVFANLLGNAVKYTRHQEQARIEVGAFPAAACTPEQRSHGVRDGEVVIYVRDNGAGFDMHYVHKLFGVFQRLHADSEFEGTGIGLANVRRIIARHGGHTWAEGKVGEGATFYFTVRPAAAEQQQQQKT
jgi:PAS domain S-box-containing protein